MAILNYANTYNEIKDNITATGKEAYKIFISGDGHFITHNSDILKDYNNKIRGLVPNFLPDVTDTNKYVFGADSWRKIIADDTNGNISPTIWASDDVDNYVPSLAQMRQYMSMLLSAVDVMRFKGTVSFDTNNNIVIGLDENGNDIILTSCEIGDTYRIADSTNGFQNQIVEKGDLFICLSDFPSGDAEDAINKKSRWQIIQCNITGSVSIGVNGTNSISVYSPTPLNIFPITSMYFPTQSGNTGLILTAANGKEPVWKNPSNIVVGYANKLVESEGVSYAVGSKTLPIYFDEGIPKVCNSTLSVNIDGNATTADKVNNVLSFGVGLTMGYTSSIANTYDGSAARTISLIPTTTTALGGVIIGDNITLLHDENDISTGKISITSKNIIDALGYTPESAATAATYQIILGQTNTSDSPMEGSTENAWINLVETKNSETTVKSAFHLMQDGKTSIVSNKDGITISSTWRDILIGGESIEDKKLNIIPGNSVCLKTESPDTNPDTVNLSFDLFWYNLSLNDGTGGYEYL